MHRLICALIARYLPMADKILVLANSKIIEQGTWDDLQSSAGYISQIEVKNSNSPTTRNTVEEKLPARIDTVQLADEDILDASRKSGDISVYCTFPILRASYYANRFRRSVLFQMCQFANSGLVFILQRRRWSLAGSHSIDSQVVVRSRRGEHMALRDIVRDFVASGICCHRVCDMVSSSSHLHTV